MSTTVKTVMTAAISLMALTACSVNTPPAASPSPVVVQTPAPQPAPSNTVVVPRSY